MTIRNTLVAAAIIAVSALLAPFYGPGIRARAASASTDDIAPEMHTVAEAYALIEKNYADPVNSEKAFYQGAIPGMLHTLDPHSSFVDPAEYREMQRRQHAQYYGVGMQITMDGPKVVVMEPFINSPAWKADLRRGDVIVAIDGKDTKGMDSGAVADLLRGPRGTLVRVSVHRDGETVPYTANVTRGEIQTSAVEGFWLKPGIVFLDVDTFEAQNVSQDVEDLMGKMGEATVNGLVLDLRDNLGGLVNEAVALAGRFLRNGQTVVSHRGRAEAEQVFRAKANPLAQKYPIVVLVNRSSASASEIVSGALQDHDRAWILGETTFGKGLVQAQFPLSEGAALLLTIAHYYTPSGRLIQRDYSHESFYDYYTRRDQKPDTQDIKLTDSGRKVYGGGGITPDEKYPAEHYNMFQRRTGGWVIFRFANNYFGTKKPELPANWQPDDAVLGKFREYIQSKNIPFTDAEFAANRDWLSGQIRYEFYYRAFGKATADRAKWMDDPEVLKAIQSLPKAQALLAGAEKMVVQRQ